MHAVTIVDGHLEWREHPDPEPGTGEVLVRVRAAGLNGADRLQVAGLYPPPPGAPVDIPGLELAGEVLALGPGANRFAVGDRVMAVVAGGGQAQRAVVNERHLLPIPDGIGWVEAGGFAEVFTTAHDALFTQAHLSLGERVCVHGAAGGVGTAGVQLAVAAGASVVATVRNPERHDDVAALGATVVDPDDFATHGPFDVVLELVGARTCLRRRRRSGHRRAHRRDRGRRRRQGRANLLALMGARGSICGSTLRARSLEDKADAARRVERHVLGLLADRTVQVPIAATYAMTDAAAAYERFAAGNKFGKIILEDPT
ncbi:MAG: alcohol dehydrogenase catalytic domain-containing protein [Acidimicrobiales bacterium]